MSSPVRPASVLAGAPETPRGITHGSVTDERADNACSRELTKGLVIYGTGSAIVAVLADRVLTTSVGAYRQFTRGQAKYLLGGAFIVASSWFGGHRREVECRNQLRTVWDKAVVKAEGAAPDVRQTSTAPTSNKQPMQ